MRIAPHIVNGHRGPLLWELHWTDLEVDEATRAVGDVHAADAADRRVAEEVA